MNIYFVSFLNICVKKSAEQYHDLEEEIEHEDIRDPDLVIFAKKKWASLRYSFEFVLKLLQRLYSRLRIYSGSCQVNSLSFITVDTFKLFRRKKA